MSYRPDGQQLASGSEDNTICLWSVERSMLERRLKGHTSYVTSVSYRPYGQQLASVSDDKTIRLWSVERGMLERRLEGHTSVVTSVCYRPDGQQLASGSADETICLWSVEKGVRVQRLEGHSNQTVHVVSYRPDGQQLASGIFLAIRLLSVGSSALEWRWLEKNVKGSITSLSYRPDSQQLATGSDDNSIYLWSVGSGVLERRLEGHTGDITSVSYRPDSQQLASASEDTTICLWSVGRCVLERQLKGHLDKVTSVSYRPDGQQLASGSWDNTIRLWSVVSGAQERKLKGHTNKVTSVSYRPDGQQLVSGSEDKTIRLWDVKIGRCLAVVAVVKGFFDYITSVHWTQIPLGFFLATGSTDATVRHWQVFDEKEGTRVMLHWSSRSHPLTTDKTIMAQVTGLSEDNLVLLQQRGAVGKPSSKLSKEVLEAREKLHVVDASKKLSSVFSKTHALHPTTQWAVTIARNRTGKAEQHAFLILESLEWKDEKATQSKCCYYRIRRFDLFEERRMQADEKERASQGAGIGWALIEVRDKDLRDIEPLVQQCVYRSWGVSPQQGQQLLENIQQDQQQRIRYATWQTGSGNNQSSHNCLTWCEGHLEKISVNLNQQKSWLDWLVVHPSRHLPDDLVRLRNAANRDAKENAEPPAEPNTGCRIA